MRYIKKNQPPKHSFTNPHITLINLALSVVLILLTLLSSIYTTSYAYTNTLSTIITTNHTQPQSDSNLHTQPQTYPQSNSNSPTPSNQNLHPKPQTQNWYQIELIIFEKQSQDDIAPEAWPHEKAPSINQHTIAIKPIGLFNPNQTTAFQSLPDDDFKMNDEAKRLNETDDYHILLHIAWNQPIIKGQPPQTIYFYGGETYDPTGQTIDESYPNESYSHDSSNPTTLFHQLEGNIQIRLTRYFELKTNIQLLKYTADLPEYIENNNTNTIESITNNFPNSDTQKHFPTNLPQLQPDGFTALHMLQTRRMRANQLNYFDHPLFGLLIKILPLSKTGINHDSES